MTKAILFLSLISLIFSEILMAQDGKAESASGFLTSLPPDAPVLFSPVNNASVDSNSATFIWNSRIHSASYNIQISKQKDFSEILIDGDIKDTSFNTTTLEPGFEYFWRVRSINVAGDGAFSNIWEFSISSLGIDDIQNSKGYGLWPAFPNPFSHYTTISYRLQERENIRLVILNYKGQFVRQLESGFQNKGIHSIEWDGNISNNSLVTSGLYYCVLYTPKNMFVKKILLLR